MQDPYQHLFDSHSIEVPAAIPLHNKSELDCTQELVSDIKAILGDTFDRSIIATHIIHTLYNMWNQDNTKALLDPLSNSDWKMVWTVSICMGCTVNINMYEYQVQKCIEVLVGKYNWFQHTEELTIFSELLAACRCIAFEAYMDELEKNSLAYLIAKNKHQTNVFSSRMVQLILCLAGAHLWGGTKFANHFRKSIMGKKHDEDMSEMDNMSFYMYHQNYCLRLIGMLEGFYPDIMRFDFEQNKQLAL